MTTFIICMQILIGCHKKFITKVATILSGRKILYKERFLKPLGKDYPVSIPR